MLVNVKPLAIFTVVKLNNELPVTVTSPPLTFRMGPEVKEKGLLLIILPAPEKVTAALAPPVPLTEPLLVNVPPAAIVNVKFPMESVPPASIVRFKQVAFAEIVTILPRQISTLSPAVGMLAAATPPQLTFDQVVTLLKLPLALE